MTSAKEQELDLCAREELLKGDVCLLTAADRLAPPVIYCSFGTSTEVYHEGLKSCVMRTTGELALCLHRLLHQTTLNSPLTCGTFSFFYNVYHERLNITVKKEKAREFILFCMFDI